jgi:diaminohydroxyphosphoribosylaminopyrimidine deaminase / 5-amino-6-(5-phosphoribosylamino)uracil reductase
VSRRASKQRVAALAKRANVLIAPLAKSATGHRSSAIDLRWLLRKLGAVNVTSLLVEGGGEVNASFLLQRLAHRVAFFYAPKILGGRDARKGVAGDGAKTLAAAVRLSDLRWRRRGADLLLEAAVVSAGSAR